MLLVAALAAGCGQSLFDNNVGGGGGGTDGGGSDGDGGVVASSCPAGCIGDAAADLDGGRSGWRYVEDPRDRTWAPMSASGGGYVGAVAGNAIKKCGSGAACTALPGALLFSTAGATSTADPALEFTVGTQQVVQLSVRVYVPTGQPEQQVRLYRNSREDVLFTAPAAAGVIFERAITVDALAGDRFLVAIAPSAMGATDVGVHVYVNTTGEVFPKNCQLAVTFSSATGNNVANACGAAFNYRQWDDATSTSSEQVPELGAGPFPELGMAADVPLPRYYLGADVLPRMTDTTTQLWVRHDAFDSSYATPLFSDMDLDSYGGLLIDIYDGSGSKKLEAVTPTGISGSTINTVYASATWPAAGGWHFVRVVHTAGQVRICLDGVRVASYVLADGKMQSTYAPRFGRNVVWTPTGAFLDGGIDDVRSFSVALPCE